MMHLFMADLVPSAQDNEKHDLQMTIAICAGSSDFNHRVRCCYHGHKGMFTNESHAGPQWNHSDSITLHNANSQMFVVISNNGSQAVRQNMFELLN